MSNLKKFDEQLATAPSVKAALQLAFVQDAFVRNYQALTGRIDGKNRFAIELFHLLEIINENDKLKAADRFSLMAALVKAGTTGLSFGKEGQLYPILYGNVVKVQIGAHGKRELLRRMPNIKFVGEGQCILKGDTYRHDKINNVLIEHVSSEKQPAMTLDNIIAAYVRLTFVDKNIDVVVYHDDLLKAKSKSKDKREDNTWNTWPGPMSQKVAYNRAYKLYYSAPQIQVGDFEAEEEDDEIVDVGHQEQPTPESVQTDPPKEATPKPKTKEKVEEAKVVNKNDADIDKYLENN